MRFGEYCLSPDLFPGWLFDNEVYLLMKVWRFFLENLYWANQVDVDNYRDLLFIVDVLIKFSLPFLELIFHFVGVGGVT